MVADWVKTLDSVILHLAAWKRIAVRMPLLWLCGWCQILGWAAGCSWALPAIPQDSLAFWFLSTPQVCVVPNSIKAINGIDLATTKGGKAWQRAGTAEEVHESWQLSSSLSLLQENSGSSQPHRVTPKSPIHNRNVKGGQIKNRALHHMLNLQVNCSTIIVFNCSQWSLSNCFSLYPIE